MQILPQTPFLARIEDPKAHFYTFISLICLKHVIVRRWKDKNKSKSAELRSGLGR